MLFPVPSVGERAAEPNTGSESMMRFAYLRYLSERGYLKEGQARILDVGPQNLFDCSLEDLVWFVERYRAAGIDAPTMEEIRRLHYFSTPRPGERTTFVAELMALTDLDYRAIDVCPAPGTDIVDLNWQAVPADFRGAFDLVLNLGTTEHLVHQENALVFLHEALRVGGVIFHQPPCTGWVNHGYFTYHPQFYRDMAAANDCRLEDLWYSDASKGPLFDPAVGHRPRGDPLAADDFARGEGPASEYTNLNAILRKTCDAPFRLPLELATSHSSLDPAVAETYPLPAPSGQRDGAARPAVSRRFGVSELLSQMESLPRDADGGLDPEIERWLADFAIPHARQETLDSCAALSRGVLLHQLSVNGTDGDGQGGLHPEVEAWLRNHALPRASAETRASVVHAAPTRPLLAAAWRRVPRSLGRRLFRR